MHLTAEARRASPIFVVARSAYAYLGIYDTVAGTWGQGACMTEALTTTFGEVCAYIYGPRLPGLLRQKPGTTSP